MRAMRTPSGSAASTENSDIGAQAAPIRYEAQQLWLYPPAFFTPEVTQAKDWFLPLWLDRHHIRENTRLFHYTCLDGMRGILKDRSFQLGHITSFNDPNELQYGQSIASEILNDMMPHEGTPEIRAFLHDMLVFVQAFHTVEHDPFVACFSGLDNSLSQWRAYAEGARGYCLGFDFPSRTRIAPDLEKLGEGNQPFFRKVIYGQEEQRELVRQYVTGVVAGARKALDRGMNVLDIGVPACEAVNVLLDMLTCFKHPAFEEENEWRLIRVTMKDHQPQSVRFREAAGGLVPYRPTYIFEEREEKKPRFPLSSVTFGPSLDPVRACSAIRLLLHHHAADGHPIELDPVGVRIQAAGYGLR